MTNYKHGFRTCKIFFNHFAIVTNRALDRNFKLKKKTKVYEFGLLKLLMY